MIKPIRLIHLLLLICILITLTNCSKSSSADTSAPLITPVTPAALPILTNFAPAKGLPNSAVTITGTNFSTDANKISVTIGGLAATIYSATAAQLVVGVPPGSPTGKVVVTSDGTVLTSASNFTIIAGTQTTFVNSSSYNFSETIAIDPLGNVYISNQSTAIYKTTLNTAPAVNLFAGANNNAAPFQSSCGIALDGSGNLYLTDRGAHNIYKITPNAAVSVLAGSGKLGYVDAQGTAASFDNLFAITTDAVGNVYVSDRACIRKITPEGLVSTFVGKYNTYGTTDGQGSSARIGDIYGMAIDAAGNIYGTDAKYFKVIKITPDGTVTTIAGNGNSAFTNGLGKNAQFYGPQGIAVDAAGNIFVSDEYFGFTYQIRMINTAGYVSTFLTGKSKYGTVAANGDLNVATTICPDGIAFDNSGNMYICNTVWDTALSTINKIVFK